MLLEVKDLEVQIPTKKGLSRPVDGVSYSVDEGQTLGIVGESGSGKSMSSLAVLQLLPPNAKAVKGEVLLDGRDILKLSEEEMQEVRGRFVSMILQDPMMSLNPVFSIGYQVGEAIKIQDGRKGKSLVEKVIDLLRLVHIPAPEGRIQDYPHQMSGGMRQRVAGSIALASDNLRLLIADEPTTALDATVQAQYLDLLKELQTKVGFALIMISHDIGVVAEVCDQIAVMYAGRIVESGPTRRVIDNPRHPYTKALLACFPRLSEVKPLEPIGGEPPNPLSFPPGCRFAPRCPRADERCHAAYPETVKIEFGHSAACWYANEQ